jgi:hypothetical protein
MLGNQINKISVSLKREKHIAPLAVLRISFGLIMLSSTIRFIAKGWVHDFYIAPKYYFSFYGFDWVRHLPAIGMYLVFALMALTAFFILIGFLYRISISLFFICFVYTELIDKTYYLNHYYLVTVFTFLMLLVPAHRYFSVDTLLRPYSKVTQVPAWMIHIFKWQLCLIYFYAGISKLNADWILTAMPLKLWLPANFAIPVIGEWLKQGWVAYLLSWSGAAFDLCIGFLLLYQPTRWFAYILVVIFHLLTGWLFKIGMFPFIMIFMTIIFFSEDFHLKLIQKLRTIISKSSLKLNEPHSRLALSIFKKKLLYSLLAGFIVLQVFLPFRYLLYPGKLFWTEEGYRFSWRVMLMEKGGITFFYVKDPKTGRKGEVINSEFLTPLQERMMQTQPDMILQYAHYLHHVYQNRGMSDPIVTVECYVTLNGSGSRLYIDSTVDLAKQQEDFSHKKWILDFHSR